MQQNSITADTAPRNPATSIWPPGIAAAISSGLTDEQLDAACEWGCAGQDATLSYESAYLFWPTELYSFGRCYREWLGWPRWLPIPVYGDHGVSLSGELAEHEVSNSARVYLTWNRARAQANATHPTKQVIRIPHPWVTYRRKHGIKLRNDAHGTLVFYPHSNDGIEIENYDLDQYFQSLQSLPAECHPLVLCMHRHDIKKGYHKRLRKYGIPIVTAGETSSPYFVDRFYDLISRFEYGTSCTGGSELFYCDELGVKFFIHGDRPVYVNRSHPQVPLGPMVPRGCVAMDADRKKTDYFSVFPPTETIERSQFVTDILGLDLDPQRMRTHLRRLFIREAIYLRTVVLETMSLSSQSSLRRLPFKRHIKRAVLAISRWHMRSPN